MAVSLGTLYASLESLSLGFLNDRVAGTTSTANLPEDGGGMRLVCYPVRRIEKRGERTVAEFPLEALVRLPGSQPYPAGNVLWHDLLGDWIWFLSSELWDLRVSEVETTQSGISKYRVEEQNQYSDWIVSLQIVLRVAFQLAPTNERDPINLRRVGVLSYADLPQEQPPVDRDFLVWNDTEGSA